MTERRDTPSPTWDQLDAVIEKHGLKKLSLIDTAALIWRLSEIATPLEILRRELQLDDNGDNTCGAEPLPGWETGYCAGLRTAYRTLKHATPQGEGSSAETTALRVAPAESASSSRCVAVPSNEYELPDSVIELLSGGGIDNINSFARQARFNQARGIYRRLLELLAAAPSQSERDGR